MYYFSNVYARYKWNYFFKKCMDTFEKKIILYIMILDKDLKHIKF